MSTVVQGKRPDTDPREDIELVSGVLDGDPQAFDVLVRRYQRQAVAVSYRLLNNRDDAMEVVQDSFLQAFDKLASLSNPERFGSWLLRIVSNRSLNKRRRRAIRRTASLDAPAGESDGERSEMAQPDPQAVSPLATASSEEIQKEIHAAIGELPDMQRQCLTLFSIEKVPQKEVAEILGCSVEAVKWHVFTARKKLKDKLKAYL